MTEELKERIAVKLFFIEQEAAQIRKWIEAGTDKDPAFLAELNAISANDAEPQGEYVATMIVEAPPEIPTLEGIKPLTGIENHIEEVIERFGLEKESETPLIPSIPDDKWCNLCRLVIIGHEGKEVSKATVTASLIKQGFSITAKQEEHLEELRKTRRAMLSKDMDLAGAQAINGLSDNEKLAFAGLAKINDLK